MGLLRFFEGLEKRRGGGANLLYASFLLQRDMCVCSRGMVESSQ